MKPRPRPATALPSALVLALSVLGATGMWLPAAGAATCSASGGVSVVVDHRELGGGIETACVPDGDGRSAASIFADAGVRLSYATRQPGFVCRVNDLPVSDPCVNTSPADAYWGLWWSDGTSPTWTYSSQGVGGLTVPDGGSVAWSWQQDRAGGGAVPPGTAAPVTRPASAPTRDPSPTASASVAPTAAPTRSPSATPSATPAPTPVHTATPTATPTATATATATATPTATPAPTAMRPGTPSAGEAPSGSASSRPTSRPRATAEPAAGPTRVPAWVTWGVLGLVAAAVAGSAAVARRRRDV